MPFCRGEAGFVAINRGEEFSGWLDTGLPEGFYRNILDPQEKLSVNSDGWAEIRLSKLSAVAILANDRALSEH